MDLRVPFGLKDGGLYEPTQVLNGKDCGCVCPGCKHPLIARQGARTPHFAHAAGEDCKRGVETAIHLAAKQLISERMALSLPPAVIHYPGGWGCSPSTELLYTYNLKKLSEVREEPWLESFRPDIMALVEGKNMEVLVEIAVTHPVDDFKLEKIKKRGMHAMEIDVSSIRESMDFALLKAFLFDVPSRGRWLYHPEVEFYENQYVARKKKEWELQNPLEVWRERQLEQKKELEERQQLLAPWKQQKLF